MEELKDRIYRQFCEFSDKTIQDQLNKKAKAEDDIVRTGKTKLDWNDNVTNTTFIWSVDIIKNDLQELSLTTEQVFEACLELSKEGKIHQLLIDDIPSRCFYIPANTRFPEELKDGNG